MTDTPQYRPDLLAIADQLGLTPDQAEQVAALAQTPQMQAMAAQLFAMAQQASERDENQC